jgi:hypothetical protein
MRDEFVATFGEADASAIEAAAQLHKNPLHDDPGSDPFRWALLICIGYQCMEVPSYREFHGIVASWGDLRSWMFSRQEWFAAHDGDVDYISLFAGKYNEYVGQAW